MIMKGKQNDREGVNEFAQIERWYSLSIEEREIDGERAFLKLYPDESLQTFYQMEFEHWNREVRQFEVRQDNPAPFETRFAVEARKMLSHYSKKLSQERDKVKPENESPTKFEELFFDKNLMIHCINVLREVEPPLLGDGNNFIGKSKGAICIWVEEMTRQGIMKHYSQRLIYAKLIPQVISGFSINESMFGKHHHRAKGLYQTDMKALLSEIKLSQDSQKGK